MSGGSSNNLDQPTHTHTHKSFHLVYYASTLACFHFPSRTEPSGAHTRTCAPLPFSFSQITAGSRIKGKFSLAVVKAGLPARWLSAWRLWRASNRLWQPPSSPFKQASGFEQSRAESGGNNGQVDCQERTGCISRRGRRRYCGAASRATASKIGTPAPEPAPAPLLGSDYERLSSGHTLRPLYLIPETANELQQRASERRSCEHANFATGLPILAVVVLGCAGATTAAQLRNTRYGNGA